MSSHLVFQTKVWNLSVFGTSASAIQGGQQISVLFLADLFHVIIIRVPVLMIITLFASEIKLTLCKWG